MKIFAEIRCRESEIGTRYFKTDITEDDLKQLAITKVKSENNVPNDGYLEVGYMYKQSSFLMRCIKCNSQEFGSGRSPGLVFCLQCHTEQKDFRIQRLSIGRTEDKPFYTYKDKDGQYCRYIDHAEKYEELFGKYLAEKADNERLRAERSKDKSLITNVTAENKQLENLLDSLCTIYTEFLGADLGEHSGDNNPWVNLASFPADHDSYVFLQKCVSDAAIKNEKETPVKG